MNTIGIKNYLKAIQKGITLFELTYHDNQELTFEEWHLKFQKFLDFEEIRLSSVSKVLQMPGVTDINFISEIT